MTKQTIKTENSSKLRAFQQCVKVNRGPESYIYLGVWHCEMFKHVLLYVFRASLGLLALLLLSHHGDFLSAIAAGAGGRQSKGGDYHHSYDDTYFSID